MEDGKIKILMISIKSSHDCPFMWQSIYFTIPEIEGPMRQKIHDPEGLRNQNEVKFMTPKVWEPDNEWKLERHLKKYKKYTFAWPGTMRNQELYLCAHLFDQNSAELT